MKEKLIELIIEDARSFGAIQAIKVKPDAIVAYLEKKGYVFNRSRSIIYKDCATWVYSGVMGEFEIWVSLRDLRVDLIFNSNEYL
jgi:hypothetical protein